jgi:glycosyltransferase involved in cell wall biosynthesis
VYEDYEHIIVDDGSKDGTDIYLAPEVRFDNRIKYIYINHIGRVVARNTGMRAATGEWICWLDSDDAYDPMYLETVDYYSKRESEVMLWVVGAVVHGMMKVDGVHVCPKWTKIRKAWMPPVNCDGEHEHFRSGKVGTGMFIFRRECLDKTGYMPDEWGNHNKIALGVDEWLGYETGYGGERCIPVGNPFGDDWAQFRRLTQFYRVHLIDAALYIHYVR